MNKHPNLIKPILISFLLFLGLQACAKSASQKSDGIKPDSGIVVSKPTDPVIAAMQGFFLDNRQLKSLVVPMFTDMETVPTCVVDATVNIDAQKVITRVSKVNVPAYGAVFLAVESK